MTIIDEVILEIDVNEFTRYFGEEVNQKILAWSKNFVSLDVNTFKNPDWDKRYSSIVLKEFIDFCQKSKQFFTINPPSNLGQLENILGNYPNITNIDEIELLIICGIRTIQMTKLPKKEVNFNWVKYIAIRDYLLI